MSNKILVSIPNLPPTWNDTYGVSCRSKKKIYKKKSAVLWQDDAAEIIRAARGFYDWDDTSPYYQLRLDFYGSKADADAYIKLAQDTLFRTLGMDDVRVVSIYLVKHIDKNADRRLELRLYGISESEALAL